MNKRVGLLGLTLAAAVALFHPAVASAEDGYGHNRGYEHRDDRGRGWHDGDRWRDRGWGGDRDRHEWRDRDWHDRDWRGYQGYYSSPYYSPYYSYGYTAPSYGFGFGYYGR